MTPVEDLVEHEHRLHTLDLGQGSDILPNIAGPVLVLALIGESGCGKSSTAARARGLTSDSPRQWLGAVGLDPDMVTRYPHQFSGGQRQRIAIARALAARPDLLVADEPISALDASSRAEVASMMRRLCLEAGAGMLFISHDLSVVRLMADRVAVMHRGRIVESGPTATVWSDPLHPYTKALLGAIPKPDGKGILPAAPAAEAPAEWRVEMPEALGRG